MHHVFCQVHGARYLHVHSIMGDIYFMVGYTANFTRLVKKLCGYTNDAAWHPVITSATADLGCRGRGIFHCSWRLIYSEWPTASIHETASRHCKTWLSPSQEGWQFWTNFSVCHKEWTLQRSSRINEKGVSGLSTKTGDFRYFSVKMPIYICTTMNNNPVDSSISQLLTSIFLSFN